VAATPVLRAKHAGAAKPDAAMAKNLKELGYGA
jgi:hypothetical protein